MGHYQRVLNENLVRRIFAKFGPLRNIVHEQSAAGPIGSFVYFETERSLTLDGWWQPYDFRGAAEFQLRAERFITSGNRWKEHLESGFIWQRMVREQSSYYSSVLSLQFVTS